MLCLNQTRRRYRKDTGKVVTTGNNHRSPGQKQGDEDF